MELGSHLLANLRDTLVYSNVDLGKYAGRMQEDMSVLKTLHDYLEENRGKDMATERRIKEIFLEAQDILDSCLIRMAAKNHIWPLHGIPKEIHLHRLAREIHSIVADKAEPIYHRITIFDDRALLNQPTNLNTQIPSVQLNKEDTAMGVKKIVGFEDEAETLINYVMENKEKLDVISITSMPGTGKTTLAWKIYHNEIIRTEFPTRVWVDIPLDFSIKVFNRTILEEFMKQGNIGYEELVRWLNMPPASCNRDSFLDVVYELIGSGKIDDDRLAYAVRECLSKSRFLFVIDDVRSKETFQSIRRSLPDTGKVIVTTHLNRVTKKSHVLRFLNEDESWELLQLEVFGKLDECPETLIPFGKRIAKNCDGWPLAISVVASSLVIPPSTDVTKDLIKRLWEKVSENVTMYITEYGTQHDVFKRLELSYIKLPSSLQNCFLYLGMFPEGQEIPARTLTRLWIAEGFIPEASTQSLEETAEQNLYDLVDRNLVMVGKTYPDGKIKTCCLHKVIYGFCKYKAGVEEFYQEITMSAGGKVAAPISFTSKHRRLCIYSCISEFLSTQPKGPFVRSILCLDKEEKEVQPKYSSCIHNSFKLLKILECRCVKFAKFSTNLSKLRNLKYMTLTCNGLEVIPEAFSSLYFLETLVLVTQSPSLDFKANIWKMYKLRHLLTKAAIVLAIQQGACEEGENLQTLSRLAPECCTEDVFTRAYNLKRLGIRGSLAALSSSKYLRSLRYLQHLKLMNESASVSPLNYLLQPYCFPPNLRSLTLSATHLDWSYMSVLGNIDSLEILKLKNNAFTGEIWNTDAANCFRSLGFLFIGTTNLRGWEASPGSFPRLKCLVLNNCKELQGIPRTLEESLDKLDVENVSRFVSNSAIRIEQKQKPARIQAFHT